MKNKFEGIGSASASLTFALLAGSPLAWLTLGIQGKITFWILKQIYMRLADKGVIVLNIGAAKVSTLVERSDFDGSFDSAFEIINKRKGNLSDAEIKAIDDKVISALRKFTDFGVQHSGDSRH